MPEMKKYLVRMTKTMEVTAESHESATAYALLIFNKEAMSADVQKKVWTSSPVTVHRIGSEVIS